MSVPKERVRDDESVSAGSSNGSVVESDSSSWAIDRWLARTIVNLVGTNNMAIRLWDGYCTGAKDADIEVTVTDRASLWKVALDPDLSFGELYSEGKLLISGDLVRGLESYYRENQRRGRFAVAVWRRMLRGSVGNFNTITRAQSNIHHHYDVGNEFYQLWLDKEMQYTCAYFPSLSISIEQAQQAKMDHICRKLRLKPGDTVVEAGCGWGSFARHMATKYGVKVRSYNISKEQIAYATERAKREGYADQVEYVQDDYRNIRGEFDVFVSVGMLEHVGRKHYVKLGQVIDGCLKPEGRGLIHSIGTMRPAPLNSWLRKHIFPGAYAPSLSEMAQIFEPNKLSILDVENLRLHYAKTLEHWLNRYEQNRDKICAMYDETFYRTYYLYLVGSIAAFYGGGLQLYQVLFNRFGQNDIAWTRDYLYHPTKV